MAHLKALTLKSAATLVVLFLVLTIIYNISFLYVVGFALVLGAVSYPLGDLSVLPKKGNTTALLLDGIITFIIIFLGMLLFSSSLASIASAALLVTVGMSIVEYFFHIYLATHVLSATNVVRVGR
ncbi:uncharacterized protein DUF2512 [Sinobaca qinghaiensis]|uniref:Uncharacterized protein DUF2512 n=1 Tax=Sinobaca qinghaiensis TaxID=342944 RepID=A0A419UWB8_9BACL|nr:DUF2512 family protein [Sinobaca qinghaiensis]RKD69425.1 uncharacterized protein DUF2512 [Sinobaca qinghaiensis]